jgi:hypothetical protein
MASAIYFFLSGIVKMKSMYLKFRMIRYASIRVVYCYYYYHYHHYYYYYYYYYVNYLILFCKIFVSFYINNKAVIAQAYSCLLPSRRPGFDPRPGNVEFAVDRIQRWWVCFCFPYQFSFLQLLRIHYHPTIDVSIVFRLSVVTQATQENYNYDVKIVD